jgi:hypothetical protein
MNKRSTIINRNRLASHSRRRQLLKRVHQKVIMRRQQYRGLELTEELAQTA